MKITDGNTHVGGHIAGNISSKSHGTRTSAPPISSIGTVKRLTLSTFCCHSQRYTVGDEPFDCAASKKMWNFAFSNFSKKEEKKKKRKSNCARLYCWISRARPIDPLVDISQQTRDKERAACFSRERNTVSRCAG